MRAFHWILASAMLLSCFSLVRPTVAAEEAQMDIVDTAVAAGDFKTLVAAVQAAGLVDALKGEGPFTVFAPTRRRFRETAERNRRKLAERQREAGQNLEVSRRLRQSNGRGRCETEIGRYAGRRIDQDHRQRWHGLDQQGESGESRHRHVERSHSRHRYGADSPVTRWRKVRPEQPATRSILEGMERVARIGANFFSL